MKKSKIVAILMSFILVVTISLSLTLTSSAVNWGFFDGEEKDPSSYAYSMAIVGDTQSLVDSDVKNAGVEGYEPRLEKLYDWLVANRESKKIEMVLGLGDITETWNEAAYPEAFAAEWELAVSEISKLDGKIPYTLVRGNHDTENGFNKYVGGMNGYTSQFVGEAGAFMAEGDYSTSYRKITVGGTKWLIVTLDWAPTGAELDWAADIIGANPDCGVIITMHDYLYHDMTLDGEGDSADTAKHNPTWDETIDPTSADNDPNLVYNPDGIWHRLVSKHSNIKMVISGHVPNGNVVYSQVTGDNGNTVTQMLVDPQSMDLDRNNAGGCGMVCMLYFKEDGTLADTGEWDGKTVDVEWYSTIKDQYYKDENQFTLDLELYEGGVATEKYGVIPAKYLDAEKYPFVTFGYDDDIDEFFFHNANSHWTTSEVVGVYPSLLRFSTKDVPAYVLLRRDFNASEAGDARYKSFGNLSLDVNLDLGGHTFVSSVYVFDANLSNATSSTLNIYGDEGSAFLVGGSSPLFWLGTNKVAAAGASFTYNFDGIRFGYAEGATAKNMLAATFSASGESSASTTQNINFTNCTFDLTNKPSGSVTMLQLNESVGSSYSVQSANVKINGGSLIANATSDVTLYSANDTDSVIFASGESGAVTLTLPADASAPAYNCYGENGKTYVFELTDEGEDTDTYTLTEKAVESKGEIDIWLIGGQSNAVGYGTDTLTAAVGDSRYSTGFENVLFYGNYESNWCPETFVPVKMGLGKQGDVKTTVGAEIGMAAVLSNSSGMNAIIKRAQGSSYLYPNTSHTVSQNYGTWTSPTYIKNHNIDTSDNKIGELYNSFIETVAHGVEMLVAEGYTPAIRGMWWMQGEAETGTQALAASYEELLTALIEDVRRDLGMITNEDLSDMPFVMGKITRNQTKDASTGEYLYSQPTYLNVVNAAQVSVTSSVANTFIVDTAGLRQLDGWHYSADSQHYIGEQFINTVIASEGKHSVTLDGANVTLSGGGAKSAGESVTVTIKVNPGCVIDSVKYVAGNSDGVEIELDANGEYTFIMPETDVVFEVVATDPNAVITSYGTIPSMYANGEEYPFVVFMHGRMLGAYTSWSEAVIASTNFIHGKDAASLELQILLRSDYSVQSITGMSIAYIGGTLVLDLADFTLTSGDCQIFNALGKATDGFVHDSRFIIKNGNINIKGGPAIAFNNVSDESYSSRKNFYFTFDNVTFGLAAGYETWHGLVVDCYDNGTVGCNGYVTLNNCKIDLKTVEPTGALNIFDLSDISNKNNVYVTVKGGSFEISDTFDTYVTLYASNPQNVYGKEKVVFAKDSSGNYPVFISDTALEERIFESADGKLLAYGDAETDGSDLVYTLVESNAVATDYGIIPEGSSDAQSKPFVLFTDGSFVSAFSTYYEFLTYISSTNISSESTLLLRKAYYSTDVDTKVSNNDRNLVRLKAPLTIDLGGNTIERGANGQHLFQFYGLLNATTDDNPINITVKNGYVHTAKNYTAPIVFNNNSTGGTEIFNVTFENVTFTSLANNSGQIVAVYTGGDASVGNIVFNGCTFDLTNMTGVAFQLWESDTVNKVDCQIQLNGCNIIMGSATKPTILKLSAERESGKGSPDSMTFGEYNGKKTTLTLASGILHNIILETAGGTLTTFANPIADGSNLVYTALTATKLAENTAYGTISADYPAEIYPFALFDGDKFIGAYRTWYHFLTDVAKSAFEYRSGGTLLLRRDYSTDECQASSQNLYHIDDLVLDLGGNTFIKAARHIFQAYGKDTSTTPSVTNITVKNGTMLAKTAAIVIFNNAATVGARAQFNFTFVNVEFGFAIGASATSMIVENYDNGTIGSDSSVVLKNCTINLKGDADFGIISPTKNVTIFNLKEKTANKNHTSVKVIGGEIIANSLSKVTLYTLNDATEIGSDSVVFAKEENGNYTSLVLQSGAESPTAEHNGFVFVKISDDGLTATYRLRPAEVANIDFVPKMSLTLDRDLILNIYVPAKSFLNSFTLDGVEYTDLEVLKKVTVGEEDYYLVSISLDAKNAARDVVLRASVSLGDKTATATFTFGIIKYAEKILADGSVVEKTLVKDVLSYVRAAYAYFGTNDAQTVSRINTILGDNYDANNAPVVEGSATAETAGLKSATFSLDGTPAMRFYLADGADASKYAFFIDGTRVKTETSADGKYIDIDVYAYALCETVTYTIDGVESGSFHIRAYYEWSKTQNNENLVNLTARFWKYLQSARDYRDSVVEG